MGSVMGRKKNGPPTIPSLPNGPEVLFFSPKVEDNRNLGHSRGKCKCGDGKIVTAARGLAKGELHGVC